MTNNPVELQDAIERVALGCPKCGQHWRDVELPKDAAAVLDAFYAAIPEEFGTCMDGGERHASVAAADPLCPRDLKWLRGIAAAIFANHPLARMVRMDQETGLYDADEPVPPSLSVSGDMRWQPIESAPRDAVILLFEPHEAGGFCFVGWWSVDLWRNTIDHLKQYPTHWMPLPEPPALSPQQTGGE